MIINGREFIETELKNIIWEVSKTGKITPIIEFTPVVIDGIKVENASMHNLTFLEQMLGKNPQVGQKLLLAKNF